MSIKSHDHRSAIGTWHYLHRHPRSSLDPYVIRLNALENVRRKHSGSGVPSPTAALVISLGGWIEVVDRHGDPRPFRSSRPYFSGLRERSPEIDFEPGFTGVVVDLTPLGARRLTDIPMSLLANRQIEAEEIFGSDIARLQSELADTADWRTRFDLVEGFLESRISAAPDTPALVRAIWTHLVASGHQGGIAGLRQQLGVSHNKLIRHCREELGLTPKRVTQLIRLDRALVLADRAPELSWSTIALRCGYYDQAHMINDFRDRLGKTPTEILLSMQRGQRITGDLPVGVLFSRSVARPSMPVAE